MRTEKKKILLVGEFSGVHSNLRESLVKQGAQCDLLSDGDGWKGFSSDISIPERQKLVGLMKLLFPIFDFFGFAGLFQYVKQRHLIKSLSNYDVIQLINPMPIKSFGAIASMLLIRALSKKSKNLYLCALGGDLVVEFFYMRRKLKYSPWSDFNFRHIKHYYQNVSFFFPMHILLYFFAYKSVKKVIPGLYEYYMAYEGLCKRTGIVPLPINLVDKRIDEVGSSNNLRILYSKKPYFGDYLKKGYKYFDLALNRIIEDSNINIEVIYANGVPFLEYQKLLNNCDIVLDQTLSYDKGMTGLLAMSYGMVSFTGNEQEVQDIYGESIPAINALPNDDYIYSELLKLINDREYLKSLGASSKLYIEKNHSADEVAKKYMSIWF